MRPARVRWIVCLQVLIIGLYTDLRTIWCIYPDEQFSVPRRLEETVWPERLPLWMEQKRIYSGYHPYVKNDRLSQTYQDIELTSDKTDHEQKQLARLRRAMSVDDVPYERFRGEGGLTDMQVGMTNPAKRAELGLAPGYRRNSAWFPIAIGVTCFLLVALAVFGTVMYYYRVYVPGTNKMDAFNKFGSQNGGSEGVAEWAVLRPAGSRTDGDRKLAHSAQMYHYQHQKQQMLAVERANGQLRGSEDGSESDTEEADFTVYECPALAENEVPEVQNPLFDNAPMEAVPSANGSSGEIIHTSDLDDMSGCTSTPRTTNSSTSTLPLTASQSISKPE